MVQINTKFEQYKLYVEKNEVLKIISDSYDVLYHNTKTALNGKVVKQDQLLTIFDKLFTSLYEKVSETKSVYFTAAETTDPVSKSYKDVLSQHVSDTVHDVMKEVKQEMKHEVKPEVKKDDFGFVQVGFPKSF